MNEQRQFLGVWFPAEIWLNRELSIIEKSIYIEIQSLDNENHCTAGNEYFADFCQVSISAVSKAIRHLKELGMVEELEFNGRVRKLRVVKKKKLPSKKEKAASENLHPNNIHNKTNNKNISIKNTNSKKSLVKRKSLYEKMQDEILLFTKNTEIQNALTQFLNLQLEIYKEQGKTYYSNIFKSRLNKLKTEFDKKDWLPVIQNAIEHGWQNFYPVKEYDKLHKKKRACDEGVTCDKYTEEELREIEKWQQEEIAKGEQMVF